MKKHPVIITAPHSYDQLPKEFKERVRLSDFELWQMSDPFTDETCGYPQAYAIHKAETHRILGDLNRDRDAEGIFRESDFYDRKIWNETDALSDEEKEELLKQYWDPFRKNILESFTKLAEEGCKKILFIDHHNTATDHPANHGQYLPPINLGNYGDELGNTLKEKLSSSPEIIRAFQNALSEEFPELNVEMNKVYKGSSLLRFVRDEISPEFPNCEIHAIQLEYNLNLIFNPISKKTDNEAKKRLHEGINRGIEAIMEKHF